QISRFAVVHLNLIAASGRHRHDRADPVAAGLMANETHGQGMHRPALGEIADEQLRNVSIIVGDNVEVAVAVGVENYGRPAGAGPPDGYATVPRGALMPLFRRPRIVGKHGRHFATANIMLGIFAIAVELEPWTCKPLSRLDT